MPLKRKLQQIASQTFVTPNGQYKKIAFDTLRVWLYRYRDQKLHGLRDKPRGRTGHFAQQLSVMAEEKPNPFGNCEHILDMAHEARISFVSFWPVTRERSWVQEGQVFCLQEKARNMV